MPTPAGSRRTVSGAAGAWTTPSGTLGARAGCAVRAFSGAVGTRLSNDGAPRIFDACDEIRGDAKAPVGEYRVSADHLRRCHVAGAERHRQVRRGGHWGG